MFYHTYVNQFFHWLLSLFVVSVFAVHPTGLDNRPVCPGPSGNGDLRCHARVVTDPQGKPTTNVTPAGYGPAQFQGAYGVTGLNAPSGTILAIVDAYDDPNIYSDLTTYSQQYNLPVLPKCGGSLTAVPCFAKVNQNGNSSPLPSKNAGWALEISLDVEIAHAICPNCTILLVEASSNSYANLMASVDRARLMGAKVISNSYGSGEFSGETSFDSYFNHQGVAYTFSSGDSGYGPSYPAASPFVTSVGGTTLSLAGTSYVGESAWSGAGSGCSAYEQKPSFQTDPSCANRTIADVSADADPNTGAAVYDSVRYQGRSGWFQVGGTSLASPLVAGVYALTGGVGGSVYANSLPYAHISNLHDVTSGSNGSCGGSYLCTSVSGYDGPTGLGSPNGLVAF